MIVWSDLDREQQDRQPSYGVPWIAVPRSESGADVATGLPAPPLVPPGCAEVRRPE